MSEAGDDGVAAEPADRLRELLERVLEAFGLTGEIEVTEDDERLVGTVNGDDLGLLIGRRGQTIDAVEHLAFRIVYRGSVDPKRLTVDAAGYRERRAVALRREAERAARDALRHRRAVALDAMTASERRIIHEHLRDFGDVQTYSEGDEPDRHLVVAPATD